MATGVGSGVGLVVTKGLSMNPFRNHSYPERARDLCDAMEGLCHDLNRVMLSALIAAAVITIAVTAFAAPPSATIAVIDASIRAAVAARPELPDDFNNDTQDDVGSVPNVVAASPSVLATIAELLGSDGSFSLNPSRPVTITKDGTKITYGPGTRIAYEATPDAATLTFSTPCPRIETRVLGLRVSPELTQLRINADNSGTAFTRSSGVNLPPKTFRLAWDDVEAVRSATCRCGCEKSGCTCSAANKFVDVGKMVTQPAELSHSATPAATQSELPQVTFYTASWCGPCGPAKTAVAQLPAAQRSRIREVQADFGGLIHRENGGSWNVDPRPSFVWHDGQTLRIVDTVEDLKRFWGAK